MHLYTKLHVCTCTCTQLQSSAISIAAQCTQRVTVVFICNITISYYTSSTTVIVGMITHVHAHVYFNKVKMLALRQIVYIYWNKGKK